MRGNTECSGCGYDLSKLPSTELTRCPECGLVESAQQARHAHLAAPDVMLLGLCIILAGIVLVIGWGAWSRAVESLFIIGLLLLWSTSKHRSVFMNVFIAICLTCALFQSDFFVHHDGYQPPSEAKSIVLSALLPLRWACLAYEFIQVPLFTLCLSRTLGRIATHIGYHRLQKRLKILDPWIIGVYFVVYAGSEFISYSSSLAGSSAFENTAPRPALAMEWDEAFYVLTRLSSVLYYFVVFYLVWILLMLLPRLWIFRNDMRHAGNPGTP